MALQLVGTMRRNFFQRFKIAAHSGRVHKSDIVETNVPVVIVPLE